MALPSFDAPGVTKTSVQHRTNGLYANATSQKNRFRGEQSLIVILLSKLALVITNKNKRTAATTPLS
jgi:hypothetical protein